MVIIIQNIKPQKKIKVWHNILRQGLMNSDVILHQKLLQRLINKLCWFYDIASSIFLILFLWCNLKTFLKYFNFYLQNLRFNFWIVWQWSSEQIQQSPFSCFSFVNSVSFFIFLFFLHALTWSHVALTCTIH